MEEKAGYPLRLVPIDSSSSSTSTPGSLSFSISEKGWVLFLYRAPPGFNM